jgi:hypothetical protein
MAFWNFIDSILYPFHRLMNWLGYLVPSGGRLGQLSWQAKATMAVWLALCLFFLLILVLGFQSDSRPWQDNLAVWVTVAVGTLVVTPILIYWGLRSFTAVPTRFADVDKAWQRGLKFAVQQDQEIAEFPVVLVLGPGGFENFVKLHSSESARSSMGSEPSDCFFWAAEHEALFLHLGKDCCHTAGEGTSVATTTIYHDESVRDGVISEEDSDDDNEYDVSPEEVDEDENEPLPDTEDLKSVKEHSFEEEGDLEVDDDSQFQKSPSASRKTANAVLPRDSRSDEVEKLKYLLTLIERFCPQTVSPHGLIVVIPREIFTTKTWMESYQQRLKQDLWILEKYLRVRIPLTFLVSFSGDCGNDRHRQAEVKGFLQLTEFLKRTQPGSGRLGYSIAPKVTPTISEKNMAEFVKQATDFMSRQLIANFADPGQLGQATSNEHLFRFACWIRKSWRKGFFDLLVKCVPPARSKSETGFQLAGVYFGYLPSKSPADSNPSDAEPSVYINGVNKKSVSLIEFVEFKSKHRQQDERLKKAAGIVLAVSILLACAVVVAKLFG